MKLVWIINVVLVLAIIGCTERMVYRYDQLEKKDVLIEVNGEKLTKGDCEARIEMRFAMMRAGGEKLAAEEENRARETMLSGIVGSFVQMSLLKSAVERWRKEDPSSRWREAYESARIKFLDRTFDGTARTPKLVELTAKLVPAQKEIFLKSVDEDVLGEALLQCAYSNEVCLSRETVLKGIENLKDYNLRVQMTNRLAWAKASNIWHQAINGADFSKLADAQSEDSQRNPGGGLGECVKNDFSDEEGFWETLEKLPEGGVSAPLQTSRGLEVVKVNRILGPEESNTGENSLDLSRVFIRLGIEVKDYTPEDLKDELETLNREKVLKKVLAEEWRKARVVCPFGPRVLPDISWRRMPDFPKGRTPKEPNVLSEKSDKKGK